MREMIPAPEKKRDSGLDAIKGLLILLVILGHAKFFKETIPFAVRAVYSFHVACFLLIPFLSPPPLFSRAYLCKISVRYLSPFLLFYTLYSLANGFIKGRYAALDSAIYDYLYGLVIAGSRAINASCDLKLLWFLPALFTLSLSRSLLKSYPKFFSPFLFMAVLCHLLAGEMGLWRYDVPWGLVVVCYIFPLGLCAPKAIDWARKTGLRLPVLLSFLTLFIVLCSLNYLIDIGDLLVYGITQYPYLILSDATLLLSITSLFLYKETLARVKALSLCGRYSMALYLFQPILLLGFNSLCNGTDSLWPLYALSMLLSIWLLAYLVKIFSQRAPRAYHFLFPRNLHDLSIYPIFRAKA